MELSSSLWLLVPDNKRVSLRTHSALNVISEEFIWATFKHTALSYTESIHLPAPFSKTPFPGSSEFIRDRIAGAEIVDIYRTS